jgi:2-dehydro-3-deoxyphosphooctonate aldolase (KDO 8-P synthase)
MAASALYARLAASRPFFLFAGPNVIESREHCLRMAHAIAAAADRLDIPFVFKASFDKANRTSLGSHRGPGLDEGLRALEAVKQKVGVPIITDIHEPGQAASVAEVADVLQIPAFLCRQTDLVAAAAAAGRVLHIKKGQWCDASVMEAAAAKARAAGGAHVIVCERGTQFGYSDLIFDPRNLVWLRKAGGLVTADVTHSLQQPGTRVSAGGERAAGGLRELIPTVARTAVACGVDGLFMEVHDDPQNSLCDAPTQWPLRHLSQLLEECRNIAHASRWREELPISLEPGGAADEDGAAHARRNL